MTEKTKNRYVVYEYNKNASPAYQGSRFYTSWVEPVTLKPDSHVDIVAENVSNNEAQHLVHQKSSNNAESFLNDLPQELRSERTDNIIRNMLKNG